MPTGSFPKATLDQVKKFNDQRYLVKGGTEGLQTVVSLTTFVGKFFLTGIPCGATVEEAAHPTPVYCPPPVI